MIIKKIKKFIPLFLIVMLLLISSGCQTNTKYSEIEEVNRYLTSEELQGRCEGSTGNIKAQSFIEGKFKDIGLSFLNEQSYLIPYDHEILDFDSFKIEFSINFVKTGVVKNLVYGSDFMPRNYIDSININCSVTSDINDPEINKKALLIDSGKELPLSGVNLQAVLIKTSLYKKSINASEKSSSLLPIIQISDNIFDELVNSEAVVSYKIDIKKRQITSNNVAGVIPGKDRSKVLVISAHFDHLGTAGKIIFPGAYDNASGTAIMIDLARRLKGYSKKSPLPFDIVLCAFNSEESGLKGSNTFVDRLDEHNTINNINLDCLGMKSSGNAQIILSHLSSGSELAEDFRIFAEGYGYKVDFGSLASDYESFEAKGFPAIGIGQEETVFIHTPDDSIDKLDVSKQRKFSDLLFDYIVNKYKPIIAHDYNKKSVEETAPLSPSEKRKNDERANMWFNQHKIFEITNDKNEKELVHSWGDKESTDDIADANSFLESTDIVLKIPSRLDEYEFNKMAVSCNSSPINHSKQNDLEKDKLYTVEDLDLESIKHIEIIYQAKDDELLHTIRVDVRNKNLFESVATYNDMKTGETEYRIYHVKTGGIIGAALKVQNNNKPYYITFSKSYRSDGKTVIDWKDEKEVEHYIKLWIAGQENG